MFVLIWCIMAMMAAWIFIYSRAREKQNSKRNFRRLSYLGSEYGLVFSGQEIWDEGVIGFDGVQRTLLFLPFAGTFRMTIIRLDEVCDCSLVKCNDTNKGQKLFWQFSFKNGKGDRFIPVGHAGNHNAVHYKERAEKWMLMVSKLISPDVKCA